MASRLRSSEPKDWRETGRRILSAAGNVALNLGRMGGKALLKKGREIQDDITRPAPPLTARQKKRRAALERESRELAKNPMDMPFCLLVILLTGIGLVMLLSASFPSAYYKNHDPMYYFARQGIFAAGGLAVMYAVSRVNYQRLRAIAKPLMYLTVFLLLLVLIPGIGQIRNNARRWIGVGQLLTFQPSEIAKAAVAIYFADSISKKRDRMRTFKEGIEPYALWLLLLGFLLMREPHLSGAILIMGTGAVQMLVGGIHLGWVGGAVGAAAAGLYFILFVVGYNTSRITSWRNPWENATDAGYQLSQSLISIGTGGLLGVGLGRSRQKFLFLPEEHNDFIFAVICEELGFIGASIIILLFAALILRGYWIALHARDRFGSLLVVGLVTLVAMQTFLNIGVVTGLLPTTGIPLPFFSYGGTAIMMQLAEMGVVLAVSRQMKIGEK